MNLIRSMCSETKIFKIITSPRGQWGNIVFIGTSTSLCIMLQLTCVYSKIQYGIEVYGHAKTSYLRKIQTKQNRALKTLFNLDYRSPTLQLHHDLNLLLVKDIKKTKKLLTLYSINKEIKHLRFLIIKTMHSHNTRQITNLHLTHPKSNLGKKSIKYYGAQEWNDIPLAIRKSSNQKSFSN